MEKLFEKLGDRLSNFFTRSVAPSSIFFVLLIFNDYFFNCFEISISLCTLFKTLVGIHVSLLYIFLILIFLSYGFINSAFSQLLDNYIKENYSEKKDLKALRTLVEDKTKECKILKEITQNDYNYYQVLSSMGNKIKSSYVDEVKAIHSLRIALFFNTLLMSYFALEYKNFLFFNQVIFILILIIFIFSFFRLHVSAKKRYEARNKRLYINFLLKKDDEEKNKNELEIKVKSIKVEIDE